MGFIFYFKSDIKAGQRGGRLLFEVFGGKTGHLPAKRELLGQIILMDSPEGR